MAGAALNMPLNAPKHGVYFGCFALRGNTFAQQCIQRYVPAMFLVALTSLDYKIVIKTLLIAAVSSPEPPLAIPVTVSQLLHGPVAPVFVREAVSACREVQGSVDPLTDMLCAIAYSEEDVTNTLMEEVMYQYNTVNSGELKNLSTLLLELLVRKQPLHYIS